MIELEVIGIPAPQGSKTRMPNGAMVDGTSATGRAKLSEWRRAVADSARAWLTDNPQGPLSGPVELWVSFRFPATKSDPYRHLHASKPDVDKIARSTCDALVHAGLLVDDSRICDLHITKRWCDTDQMPGATVKVNDLTVIEHLERGLRKQAAKERRHGSAA